MFVWKRGEYLFHLPVLRLRQELHSMMVLAFEHVRELERGAPLLIRRTQTAVKSGCSSTKSLLVSPGSVMASMPNMWMLQQ